MEAAAPAIRETLDAGEAFSKQFVVYSDDGGETWSNAEEIPVDNENDKIVVINTTSATRENEVVLQTGDYFGIVYKP